jgi:uncharacterized OB-fold protein
MSNVDFKPDTKLFGGMQGWTCPRCGRVYSPLVQTCSYCNHKISTQENRNSNFSTECMICD